MKSIESTLHSFNYCPLFIWCKTKEYKARQSWG